MYSIARPKISHPGVKTNDLGLTIHDYLGANSTLCGGCGHDSITAAIVQACFELSIAPHKVAKMSGIGCSSKTPAYFLSSAHGFNSVHGRMPSVTTGANAANRDMYYLAVSGDGDTGSIGLGQFMHAIRRRLDMLYIIENNGVYGLTKGQFSAMADVGSKTKRGDVNTYQPLDPVTLAIQLGATFVARGFSGDKGQLVPMIKAALSHRGFALLDVLSPCVSFSNHEGSTRSYQYIRQHEEEALHIRDFVPVREEITTSYDRQVQVELHDGSTLILSKEKPDYDLTDIAAAVKFVEDARQRGEIATGVLLARPGAEDFHDMNQTPGQPLRDIPFAELCPGAKALDKINQALR